MTMVDNPPADDSPWEMFRITLDPKDGSTHVEVEDMCDEARTLGLYLADAAYAIARDYTKEQFDVSRDDGDMFSEICDGFIEAMKLYQAGLRNNSCGGGE